MPVWKLVLSRTEEFQLLWLKKYNKIGHSPDIESGFRKFENFNQWAARWQVQLGWNKPAQPQFVVFGVINQRRPGFVKILYTCKNH